MDRKSFITASLVASGSVSAALAADSPPNYVLVHGAFADSFAWSRVAPLLQKEGATVSTFDLPGHSAGDNARAGSVTLADYVSIVVANVKMQPGPVILVGHSMGGIVVTQVAEEVPERIASLVYLSAYLPENGRSLLSYAMNDRESKLGPGLQPDQAHGVATISPETMRGAFFNDSSEQDASAGIARLRQEPLQPFVTPVHTTASRFGSVKRSYIKTTDDRAVGPMLQQAMIEALPCKKVYTLAADHSSYFSATRKLVDALLDVRVSA